MEVLRPRPLRLRAPPGRPPPRRRRRPPGPGPAAPRATWALWVGVAALAVAVAAAAAAAAETDAVDPAVEPVPQPLALSRNRLVEASGGGGGEGGAEGDPGVLGDPQQLPPVTQGASNSVDAEEGGANGDGAGGGGGGGVFEPQDQAPAPPPPAPPDHAASPAPQAGPTLEPDGREVPEETAAPQPPSAAPDEGAEAGEAGEAGEGGDGDGGGEGQASAPSALPPAPPRVDESGWTVERSPPPPTQPLEWTPAPPSPPPQPAPPRAPFTPEPSLPPPAPPSPSPSPTPRFSPQPPPPPPSTRPPPPPPPPSSPSPPPPPPPTPTAPPVVSLYPSSQSAPPATPSEAPSTPEPTPLTTPSTLEQASCVFGASPRASLCGWTAESNGSLRWAAGTGRGANWVGGPPRDVDSDDADGGYAFLETSLPATAAGAPAPVPAPPAPANAQLLSAQLAGTGSGGTCLVFWYAMDGLSPAELSVLLRRTERGSGARPGATATDSAPAGASSVGASAGAAAPRSGGGGGAGPPVPAGVRPAADLDALSRDADAGDRVLWQAPFRSPHWQEARLLYTFHTHHTLIFEGWPVDASDPARAYRGYIAVDSVRLRPGAQCRGHCTFAAGFCDWSNERGDDFDWALSRGSHNPVTGPSRDSSRDAAGSGGYAFVDSAFPRRPGDRARLASAAFPATEHDHPLCMRLWFHMFGPAVGSLRVLLRRFFHEGPGPATSTLWELSGNAGNAWFMGELTVSSLNDYQVLLEATVGNTGMSDIAVDDLSFTQGPCPAAPQVAAPDAGDCTFEIDECGWASSGNRQGVEWERAPTRSLDARFRRRPRPSPHAAAHRRDEYFLSLGRRPLQSAGSVTQFTSREFPGSQQPRCLTFWYLMREPFIDVAGPSLGVLRVLVQTAGDNARPLLAPLWQLYNHQGSAWALARAPIAEQKPHRIIFEGIWGPNRAGGTLAIDDIAFYEGNCTIQPAHATLRPEDCSFERGLCGWSNWTRTRAGERLVTWQRAFDSHRPAHLADKTFGTADGYIFFDIFATNQVVREVRLVAGPARPPPGAPRGPLLCFTFWFAAFGAGDSTHLSLLRYPTAGDLDDLTPHTLWRLSALGLDTTRPAWAAAQVTLDAREPGRLVLSGAASNGGFAVDDVRVLPGGCPVRPKEANPTTQ